jgi:hypothetical protein
MRGSHRLHLDNTPSEAKGKTSSAPGGQPKELRLNNSTVETTGALDNVPKPSGVDIPVGATKLNTASRSREFVSLAAVASEASVLRAPSQSSIAAECDSTMAVRKMALPELSVEHSTQELPPAEDSGSDIDGASVHSHTLFQETAVAQRPIPAPLTHHTTIASRQPQEGTGIWRRVDQASSPDLRELEPAGPSHVDGEVKPLRTLTAFSSHAISNTADTPPPVSGMIELPHASCAHEPVGIAGGMHHAASYTVESNTESRSERSTDERRVGVKAQSIQEGSQIAKYPAGNLPEVGGVDSSLLRVSASSDTTSHLEIPMKTVHRTPVDPIQLSDVDRAESLANRTITGAQKASVDGPHVSALEPKIEGSATEKDLRGAPLQSNHSMPAELAADFPAGHSKGIVLRSDAESFPGVAHLDSSDLVHRSNHDAANSASNSREMLSAGESLSGAVEASNGNTEIRAAYHHLPAINSSSSGPGDFIATGIAPAGPSAMKHAGWLASFREVDPQRIQSSIWQPAAQTVLARMATISSSPVFRKEGGTEISGTSFVGRRASSSLFTHIVRPNISVQQSSVLSPNQVVGSPAMPSATPAANTSFTNPRIPTSPPLPRTQNASFSKAELNQLASRVYELLVRRIASERQRRGI